MSPLFFYAFLSALFQHAQQAALEDLTTRRDQLGLDLGRAALRLAPGFGLRLLLLALRLAALLILQLLLAAACFILQLLLALALFISQLLLALLVGFLFLQPLLLRFSRRLSWALRSASACLAASAFSASSVSTS